MQADSIEGMQKQLEWRTARGTCTSRCSSLHSLSTQGCLETLEFKQRSKPTGSQEGMQCVLLLWCTGTSTAVKARAHVGRQEGKMTQRQPQNSTTCAGATNHPRAA